MDAAEKEDPFIQNILRRIRSQLNQDKVKLWLPPYTLENGEKGDTLELINRYASIFGFQKDAIALAVEELRCHAVAKLASRKRFTDTGIATLNIRLSGQISDDADRNIEVESNLQVNGSSLKERIRSQINSEIADIKLISSGRILDDEGTLQSQGVKNCGQIMAICLSKSSVDGRQRVDEQGRIVHNVEETRKVAEALSKRKDAGKGKHERYYLEIHDQSGKPIQLPEIERQALSLAMTLHEMGRDLLKKKEYSEAILFLLEADQEFLQCRSEILDAVDNYAVLCLDVVWCYFSIKNLENLPDAELKLKKCRDFLTKSYGPKLERVNLIKGSSENELTQFVRLHLLEAICAYLREQYDLASQCLDKAEEGVRRLEVDDIKLSQVMGMGFDATEARMGLRACQCDVTLAVDYITRQREDKSRRSNEEKDKRSKWKLSRKFGKTVNGEWLDIDAYKSLTGMGFADKMAAKALRHANNDINQALEILQTTPELLVAGDDSYEPKRKRKVLITDELILQVASMGFSCEIAKKALERYVGDVQKCVEELLANNGVLPGSSRDSSGEPDSHSPEENSVSGEESSTDGDEDENAIDRKVSATMKHIGEETQNYLDLTFEEEARLITEYRLLLSSMH